MASIYEAFGVVDLVPCADELSPVIAERRIMPSADGNRSTDQWSGRLIFMNPPYSEQLKSLRRAYERWIASAVDAFFCLVPVRTDLSRFHEVPGPIILLSDKLRRQQRPARRSDVTLGRRVRTY